MASLASRSTLVLAIALLSHAGDAIAVPAPPANLSATVNGSTVTLTWTAPPTPVIGYRLLAGTAPRLSNVANFVLASLTSITATDVPAGIYYARVQAIGTDGDSGESNEVIIVVGGSGCVSPPGAPTLTASVSGLTVSFTWTAPAGSCAATRYTLYVGTASERSDIAIIQLGNVLNLTGAAPAGTYFARVVAANAFGSSAASNEVTVVVGAGGGVEVLAPSLRLGEFNGNTVVFGEVVNNSSAIAVYVTVDATFLAPNGTTLGRHNTLIWGQSRRSTVTRVVTPTTLAPGEHGCFAMYTSFPRAQVADVRMSTSFLGDATEEPSARLVFDGEPNWTVRFGQALLEGRLRNTGTKLTYLTSAVFLISDGAGRTLDCAIGYVSGTPARLPDGSVHNSGLEPGASAPFSVFTVLSSPAGTVRKWIAWGEYE